jgi:glycosyltransferase involved in cell wall biosynthesis
MGIVYSIIVPAYNEEKWLPATLQALNTAMAAQSDEGELIVCDNNSTDSTAAIAEAAGARVVFEPHNQISRARNRGAREARGDYLVFVDADTRVSAGLLGEALARLGQGRCVGGGTVVEMDRRLRLPERLGQWFWNRLSITLRLAAGSFLYCRREAFEAVGGFSEAVYASEELWLSRQLRRWGRSRGMRFCILREHPAITSGRKLEWFAPWQQAVLILALLLFPFLVRYRRFCGFWYKRPPR